MRVRLKRIPQLFAPVDGCTGLHVYGPPLSLIKGDFVREIIRSELNIIKPVCSECRRTVSGIISNYVLTVV